MNIGSDISRFQNARLSQTAGEALSEEQEWAIEATTKELAAFSKIFSNLAQKAIKTLIDQHIDNEYLENAVAEIERVMEYHGFLS